MSHDSSCAFAGDARHFPRSTELHLADVTNALAQEFEGKVDRQVVRHIVRDSYERLMAHVPRTAEHYLEPWARQRLLGRMTAWGREPTLAEILTVPTQRL
jgi:hypothetical protein